MSKEVLVFLLVLTWLIIILAGLFGDRWVRRVLRPFVEWYLFNTIDQALVKLRRWEDLPFTELADDDLEFPFWLSNNVSIVLPVLKRVGVKESQQVDLCGIMARTIRVFGQFVDFFDKPRLVKALSEESKEGVDHFRASYEEWKGELEEMWGELNQMKRTYYS